MATMQWASKAGRREERAEGSAWLARVCAPRAAIPLRVAYGGREETTKHTKHTKNIFEPRMDTNGPRMSFFMKRRHCFSIFRVFRAFRGYDCFAILVCIRVHSWFK